MPEEQAYNAVVREDRGSLLVELNDAQNYTLERLSVLVDRLNNVSENAVEGKALAGSLPGSNHLAARVSTQHEINAKINNIIGGLVL